MERTYETFLQYGALGAICVVLVINSAMDRRERRAMWNELLEVAKNASNGYSELAAFLKEKFK